MYIADKKTSNSYRFIEYLFKNPRKLLQNTDIATGLGIKRNSLSYTASRMKDFFMTDKACEGILKIIIANGRRIYYKCTAESIDDVESLTLKYHQLYKQFNIEYDRKRQNRDDPNKDKGKVKQPAIASPPERGRPFLSGKPIDVPIRIAISVKINLAKG